MTTWVDFKAIKEAADFRPILEHYGIELKAKGPELSGLCPFHKDTKPSFRLNLERGIFHCFGCGAKGNILDFVSRKEGVTIRTAARLVAEWCGLEGYQDKGSVKKSAPRGSPRPAREAKGRKTALDTAEEPAKPSEPAASEDAGAAPEEANRVLTFTLNLDSDHPYLKERGLEPQTISTFGLGYCGRGVMKGRVAIPIHNEAGELVAYAGRWPGEPPEGEDKYKLPTGFKKSRVLYNLHRVKEHEELVIVEGFFDVMRLAKSDVPTVALMGRSLSEEQEELLASSGVRRLVLMLDGNPPGRKATEELLPRLAQRFFVRVVPLPDDGEPDTISEEELRKLLSGTS